MITGARTVVRRTLDDASSDRLDSAFPRFSARGETTTAAMSAGAMRAAVPRVAVASARGDSPISNSRNSVATAPGRGRPGRRDVLPQPRAAPRDTATVGTPQGLESFDRHFSDLINGATQPSPSRSLAEHEEESPYYGVDDDDEDDDEDDDDA